MSLNSFIPKPLFDTLEHTCDLYKRCQIENQESVIRHWLNLCLSGTTIELPLYAITEYGYALRFLYEYRGSFETFNAYRREIDRLLQWSWFVQEKSILQLKRLNIEGFIAFCQKPPKRWMSLKTVSRFITNEGIRVPNSEWRPFVAKISKKAFQEGEKPIKASFELSQQGIKQIFAILGSFYNALIQEEVTELNPGQTVLTTTKQLAEQNPMKHKRTLFMLQMLYSLYLRISELASTSRWSPKMADFFRDVNDDWWFKTVGKGNKMRKNAVSTEMLDALRQYRECLGYSPPPPS